MTNFIEIAETLKWQI